MKQREFTPKERRKLEANRYTYKVTRTRLYFTAEFKREYWERYEAGRAPRKILEELGYDLSLFTQRHVDGLTARIKKEAESGEFREGTGQEPGKRAALEANRTENLEPTPENMRRIWNRLQYLEQEVEFIKKIRPAATQKRATR